MIPRSIVILVCAVVLLMGVPAWAQYPIVTDDVVCETGLICHDNPVTVGATVITSGTTTTLFTVTSVIGKGSVCNNQTSGAVTLTVTDGNNVQFNTAFSIPANSYLSFNDRIGAILAAGIKVSASAANAIICWFNVKQ